MVKSNKNSPQKTLKDGKKSKKTNEEEVDDLEVRIQEKLIEQKRLEEEANEARNLMGTGEDDLRINLDNMSQLNQDNSGFQGNPANSSTEKLLTPKGKVKGGRNKRDLETYEAKSRLVDKENKQLELKIKLAKEQKLLLQAQAASSAPAPSAGKVDINDNFKAVMNESSVNDTQDGDVLDCVELDGFSTTRTMSHSIEHEGILNNRDMLKMLEPHQQGVLSVIRLFFSNLPQLPVNIRSSGGQHWKKFVAEVEQNKINIDDLIDFNNRESLKVLFQKVGEAMKELFKLCSPSSSIGTLLLMMQWLEQTSTKKLFGTKECKTVCFSFKILEKQNRQMFQSDVNTLASWRSIQDSRRTNRDFGRNNYAAPYARRGGASFGGSGRGGFRGNYRGSFRARGGRSRGRGSYGGSRGAYGTSNAARE